MKFLKLAVITLFSLNFVMACGTGNTASSDLAAVPAKTYQIKQGSLCWDVASNDVHAFLRSCSGTPSSKFQILPVSGKLYANNSDYVRIMSLSSTNFFRCLAVTHTESGIGDLIWTSCSTAGSPKVDQEAQKFYLNRTGNQVFVYNYKSFFMSYPNPKSTCVVKNPASPLITDNYGCTTQQQFTLVQLN